MAKHPAETRLQGRRHGSGSVHFVCEEEGAHGGEDAGVFHSERGLRPRNRFLGEDSEGAVEAPSDDLSPRGASG